MQRTASAPLASAAAHRASATMRIYVPIAVFALACALIGFWHSYYGPLLSGTEQVRTILEVHAAIFVGWIVIVAVQAWLAATHRLALHVRAGHLAFLYGLGVVLLGLVATLHMFGVRLEAGQLRQAHVNVFVGLTDIATFAVFLAAAWWCRRRPEIHKRLIVVTTTVLLVAPVHRMHWLLGGPPVPIVPLLLIWLAPLYIGMIHDYLTRRLVHPVYLAGIAAIVSMKFLRAPLFRSDAWDFVARSIESLTR
jgi:hypothetical protein